MTFTRVYQSSCVAFMNLIYGPQNEGIPYDYVADNLRRQLIDQCKLAISNRIEVKVSKELWDREIERYNP